MLLLLPPAAAAFPAAATPSSVYNYAWPASFRTRIAIDGGNATVFQTIVPAFPPAVLAMLTNLPPAALIIAHEGSPTREPLYAPLVFNVSIDGVDSADGVIQPYRSTNITTDALSFPGSGMNYTLETLLWNADVGRVAVQLTVAQDCIVPSPALLPRNLCVYPVGMLDYHFYTMGEGIINGDSSSSSALRELGGLPLVRSDSNDGDDGAGRGRHTTYIGDGDYGDGPPALVYSLGINGCSVDPSGCGGAPACCYPGWVAIAPLTSIASCGSSCYNCSGVCVPPSSTPTQSASPTGSSSNVASSGGGGGRLAAVSWRGVGAVMVTTILLLRFRQCP